MADDFDIAVDFMDMTNDEFGMVVESRMDFFRDRRGEDPGADHGAEPDHDGVGGAELTAQAAGRLRVVFTGAFGRGHRRRVD